MIEVIGSEGSSEHRVALAIAEAIKAIWPEVEGAPCETDHVRIASNVKISGYQVNDIDVVVCGRFNNPRYFRPRRLLRDKDGNRLAGRPVAVDSFVVAVEVKDHSAGAIRISGEKVEVKYTRGGPPKWKSATDQNIAQVHSLKAYLADRTRSSVFVHRCLALPNLQRVRSGGAVCGTFDGHDFFTGLAETNPVLLRRGQPILSSANLATIGSVLSCPLFKEIVPSNLDRQRMDRIARRSPATEKILADAGERMVLLRGHGGTGKTVALLQAAWTLFRERGERTLFLTYNHALAADVRRLMALIGVPAGAEDGGIAIETVMSFMYSWLAGLNVLDDEEINYDAYPQLLAEAVEHLEAGAVTRDDIEALRAERPDRFDFDHFFVDEGQDWPADEVRLLKAFHGAPKLCIADGIDQLTRGAHVDWTHGVPRSDRTVVPLKACLRMKRNLALFAAEAATSANLGWDMKANEKAGGGRIFLLRKSYDANPEIHQNLLATTREAGNSEIDFLFCVPPSNVLAREGRKTSRIAEMLARSGHKTWDGVDPRVRGDFPRDASEFRVVQYQSCRGLEGWTVVLEGLDEFIETKRSEKQRAGLTDREREALLDLDAVANQFAWRHALIALTRPIDTLVITLTDTGSAAARELLRLAEDFPDSVELPG